MTSDGDTSLPKRFLRDMCQHLVGLSWFEGTKNANGEFTTPPQPRIASGFLLEVCDRVCLITAGHVYSEFEERMVNHGIIYDTPRLLDCWSKKTSGNCTSIPFDFFDTPMFPVHDDEYGLDFCVLDLTRNTLELLTKTTLPFWKKDWRSQPKIEEFHHFKMLGLPFEAGERQTTYGNSNATTVYGYRPVMIAVDRNSEPPIWATETEFERFYGTLSPTCNLTNIRGMSGGPIFGFQKQGDGRWKYWPVAIQSAWNEKKELLSDALCRYSQPS